MSACANINLLEIKGLLEAIGNVLEYRVNGEPIWEMFLVEEPVDHLIDILR